MFPPEEDFWDNWFNSMDELPDYSKSDYTLANGPLITWHDMSNNRKVLIITGEIKNIEVKLQWQN